MAPITRLQTIFACTGSATCSECDWKLAPVANPPNPTTLREARVTDTPPCCDMFTFILYYLTPFCSNYGQYWETSGQREESQATRGRRQLHATGRVPPPYVHSRCEPSRLTSTAWPSANNTIMAVTEPKVRCGDQVLNLTAWQSMGFDVGSRVELLPNTSTWPMVVVEGIMTRVRQVLEISE